MAVRFLKSTATTRPNRTLRPSGYTFPAGLNNIGDPSNGPTSVDYLIVAGGGGGGGAEGGGGGRQKGRRCR